MDRIVSDVKDLIETDIIIKYIDNVMYNSFKVENPIEIDTLEHVLELELVPTSSDETTFILNFIMSSSLLCIKDKKAIVKSILDTNVALNKDNGLNIIIVTLTIVTNEMLFTLYVGDVIENNNTELLLEVLEFGESILSNSVNYSKITWIQTTSISEWSDEYKESINDFLNNKITIKG